MGFTFPNMFFSRDAPADHHKIIMLIREENGPPLDIPIRMLYAFLAIRLLMFVSEADVNLGAIR